MMKRIKIIGVDGATDYIRPVIIKLPEEDFEFYKSIGFQYIYFS